MLWFSAALMLITIYFDNFLEFWTTHILVWSLAHWFHVAA